MTLFIKIIGWFLVILTSLGILCLDADNERKPWESVVIILVQGLTLFYISWTLFN